MLRAGLALAQAAHPLDPLSEAELKAAVKILKESGKMPPGARFPVLALNEPPKQEVYRFSRGQPFRREAYAVLLDRGENRTYEAVVDLRAGKVLSFRHVPGVQPLVLNEEYALAQELVRKDPRWVAALRRRGIADKDLGAVALEPWAVGHSVLPAEVKGRALRVMTFYKGDSVNRYARPVEGLLATVDLSAKKVIEVSDTGVVPISPYDGDYDAGRVGPLRAPPKELRITHPQGPSFTIEGNEIRWQKWRFRISVHPRDGLLLHTVSYQDGGRARPVLYRASLSEMAVPYGDADGNWTWRNAFDVGEYGLGQLGCSLLPGADVPAYATLLDAVLPQEDGSARTVRGAVAVYEKDAGVLWRHWDYVTDRTDSRRARDLAVSYMAAIGNYDYMMTWVFQQDGAIRMDADLTGIMLAKGVAQAKETQAGRDRHGHLVAPGVSAIHHQHFFLFRLDMDVDGTANSVLEMNSEPVPMGAKNPAGNAFTMDLTPLRSEAQAQRDLNLQTSRKWLVVNPARKNSLGAPTGYLLVPGENAVPMADPESAVRKRAAFINHHVWVTRFAPRELYGSGEYPNQNNRSEGLPVYAADNQPLPGTDLVLWYCLGVTHIPRPEEWPIMAAHRAGFQLLPAGFFTSNPSLDVPPPARP